jgi:hypothetical protein
MQIVTNNNKFQYVHGYNYWNRLNYIEQMKIELVTISGNVNSTKQ